MGKNWNREEEKGLKYVDKGLFELGLCFIMSRQRQQKGGQIPRGERKESVGKDFGVRIFLYKLQSGDAKKPHFFLPLCGTNRKRKG